jgi:hypothetical protein
MEGTLLVDPKSERLAGISGKLMRDVNFGWGILGTLHKGGTFDVKRADVGSGVWKETLTDVNISGHALFFHTISEQQHDVRSRYQRVDQNISPLQAANLLIQHVDEATASKTAALRTQH